ncbi:MAG: hypothetical protein ACTSSA_05855 [Candidatus Freyarchaeota archaeon]
MGKGVAVKKVFPICPCLFKYGDEYFCLGRDELYPLSFVIPVHFEVELPTNEEDACHDLVYADDSGLICCGSTGMPIKVRGKHVLEDMFSELYQLAMTLFDPEDVCRECMYNLLSFDRIQRKLTFLFFTSGAPKCTEFEKELREAIESLKICEDESPIVRVKFAGKIKEAFKSRIKKLPTVYIIDQRRKIGEIVGVKARRTLEKILRRILGLNRN